MTNPQEAYTLLEGALTMAKADIKGVLTKYLHHLSKEEAICLQDTCVDISEAIAALSLLKPQQAEGVEEPEAFRKARTEMLEGWPAQPQPAPDVAVFNAITRVCSEAPEGSSLRKLLVSQRSAIAIAALAAMPAQRGVDGGNLAPMALRRLVNLKKHKDKHGKDAYYEFEQPIAWRMAEEALAAIASKQGGGE